MVKATIIAHKYHGAEWDACMDSKEMVEDTAPSLDSQRLPHRRPLKMRVHL